MSTPSNAAPAFPVGAVAVNLLGGLFLAAGVLGLFAPEALSAVPALKDRATAWTLIAVGVVLDLGAAMTIVAHIKSRRQRR